jgi:hypothetical protein
MRLGAKQELFSRNLNKLISWVYEHTAFEIRRGEALRPAIMQRHYVKVGRSKTMNSQHGKKLASDLFFFLNGHFILSSQKLQSIGDYWESLNPNNRWGGNWKSFKDVPHFEMRG